MIGSYDIWRYGSKCGTITINSDTETVNDIINKLAEDDYMLE